MSLPFWLVGPACLLQEFPVSVSHCGIPSRLPQIGIFYLGSRDSNSDLQLNQYVLYLMSLHQPLGPSCQGPYHLTVILLRTKPQTQEHLEDRPFQTTAATSVTLTQ